MSCFRKSWHKALVETCSDCPGSCDRNTCRQVRLCHPTVLSMIGPNRAAAFNRGKGEGMHIERVPQRLFELNATTLSFRNNSEQRDERQIHCWPAWGKTGALCNIVSFRSSAGW